MNKDKPKKPFLGFFFFFFFVMEWVSVYSIHYSTEKRCGSVLYEWVFSGARLIATSTSLFFSVCYFCTIAFSPSYTTVLFRFLWESRTCNIDPTLYKHFAYWWGKQMCTYAKSKSSEMNTLLKLCMIFFCSVRFQILSSF